MWEKLVTYASTLSLLTVCVTKPVLAVTADEAIKVARKFISTGEPAKAIEWTKQAIQLEPRDPRVLAECATALQDSGDFTGELACAQQGLSFAPYDIELLFRAGTAAELLHQPVLSIRYLDCVLAQASKARKPLLYWTYVNRSADLIETNRPAEAIVDAKHALEIDRTQTQAYFRLCEAYETLHLLDDAAAALRAPLTFAPSDAESVYKYAVLLMIRGNYDEAIQWLQRADTLSASKSLSRYILCDYALVLLQKKRYADALKAALRAVSIAPTDSLARYRVATSYKMLNKIPEATSQLAVANSLDHNPYLLWERGTLLFQSERYEEALSVFVRTNQLLPSNASGELAVGLCEARLKRWSLAAQSFTKAIALDPKTSAAYLDRAEAFLSLRRYDDALKDCNSALKFDAKDALALYRRACAHRGLHQYELALKDFDKCIELEDRFEFVEERANLLLKLKRFENVVADSAKALKLSPSALRSSALKSMEANVQTGNYEQAIDDFAAIIRSGKKRETPSVSVKDMQSVVSGYSKVLSISPDEAAIYYNRAIAYICMNQPKLAAKDLHQFMNKSDLPKARLLAATYEILALKLDHEDALAKERLVAEQVVNPRVWPGSAITYLRNGLTGEDLVKTAKSNDDIAVAKCFVALNEMATHKTDSVRLFSWIVEHSDDRLDEYTIAQSLLEHLRADRD